MNVQLKCEEHYLKYLFVTSTGYAILVVFVLTGDNVLYLLKSKSMLVLELYALFLLPCCFAGVPCFATSVRLVSAPSRGIHHRLLSELCGKHPERKQLKCLNFDVQNVTGLWLRNP